MLVHVRRASQGRAAWQRLSGSASTRCRALPVRTQSIARGKALLVEKCGRCHAVEAVGESPLKGAPPMRDVYARFAPRELQEELLEGMVSRHKEMPQIQFSQEDVAAIMAYLYELASRR